MQPHRSRNSFLARLPRAERVPVLPGAMHDEHVDTDWDYSAFRSPSTTEKAIATCQHMARFPHLYDDEKWQPILLRLLDPASPTGYSFKGYTGALETCVDIVYGEGSRLTKRGRLAEHHYSDGLLEQRYEMRSYDPIQDAGFDDELETDDYVYETDHPEVEERRIDGKAYFDMGNMDKSFKALIEQAAKDTGADVKWQDDPLPPGDASSGSIWRLQGGDSLSPFWERFDELKAKGK